MGNIEIFDRMAEQYDTAERVAVARIIADFIRRHVGEVEGKRALDYGCGTGLVGLELADLFDSVLFVDASEPMVAQVRRKIRSAGLDNAHALCCDLTSGRTPGLHADYVIAAQVLLHIRDIVPLLARLFTLLDPGGHLLIVDFDRDEGIVSDKVHGGFNQAELVGLCRKAGFSKAGAQTFFHGRNLFMGRDASLFLLDAVK